MFLLTHSTASPPQLMFRVYYNAVKHVATQMSPSKQVNKQVTSLFNMGSCETTRQGGGVGVRVGGRVRVKK